MLITDFDAVPDKGIVRAQNKITLKASLFVRFMVEDLDTVFVLVEYKTAIPGKSVPIWRIYNNEKERFNFFFLPENEYPELYL